MLVGKAFQISYLDSPQMLLWLMGITLFVGLLSGSYPALFISGFHPVKILKGEMTSGITGSVLRRSLVVAQFTLSILLIISTAIVYQQLDHMQSKQLGFDKDQVVVIPLIGGVERDFNAFKERTFPESTYSACYSICTDAGTYGQLRSNARLLDSSGGPA